MGVEGGALARGTINLHNALCSLTVPRTLPCTFEPARDSYRGVCALLGDTDVGSGGVGEELGADLSAVEASSFGINAFVVGVVAEFSVEAVALGTVISALRSIFDSSEFDSVLDSRVVSYTEKMRVHKNSKVYSQPNILGSNSSDSDDDL